MRYSENDLQRLAFLRGGTSEEARELMAAAQTEMERRAAEVLAANPAAGRISESEYDALRSQAEALGVPFEEHLHEMAILRAFALSATQEMAKGPKIRRADAAERLGGELPSGLG